MLCPKDGTEMTAQAVAKSQKQKHGLLWFIILGWIVPLWKFMVFLGKWCILMPLWYHPKKTETYFVCPKCGFTKKA